MKKRNEDKYVTEEGKNACIVSNENTCISCGAAIPEGSIVCLACEYGERFSRCCVCGRLTEGESSMCAECASLFSRSSQAQEEKSDV